jgi:hypothetical protein
MQEKNIYFAEILEKNLGIKGGSVGSRREATG